MKKNLYIIAILIFALIATSCGTTAPKVEEQAPVAAPVNASPEQTITIGLVSDDPAEEFEVFQPLADYLAQNLADQNILTGNVVVVATLEDMEVKLKSGEVDLFIESPFGAVDVYENAGAVPVARRWKKGVGEYYSVIITLKSGNINQLNNLRGKMVAFDDPVSTSGYILPKALIVERGFTMTEKSEPAASVEADEIGYYFAQSAENSIALLLANQIDAMGIELSDYEELPADQQDQTKIIAETQAVPRHMVMGSPTLDAALLQAITDVLLGMENSEEGLAVLELNEKTARFDLFPPLGPEKTMSELVELFNIVR